MARRLRWACAACVVVLAALAARFRTRPPPAVEEVVSLCAMSTHLDKLVTTRGVPDQVRRRAIAQMAADAWCGYRTHAWGADDLHPLSKTGANWLHLSLTAADSIDTLLIMGMRPQAEEAIGLVLHRLSNRTDATTPVFDTVIRVLAGVMSAYSLTTNTALLQAAITLANDVSFAFDSRTGIPASGINLATHQTYSLGSPNSTTTHVVLAEAGTLCMEYDAVSQAIGTPRYR